MTNTEALDDFLLSLPSDPSRAFNISPETNVGAHVEEDTDELRNFMPKSHVIGALAESSLPSSPGKQRRVSFDLDLDDKEEKSSSRSRKDSDSGGKGHSLNASIPLP